MFKRFRRQRSRGQSLVEFALILPIMVALLGGIVQFGLLFWAQNTLTQVVRDTGRWAATQQNPCWPSGNSVAQAAVLAQANSVAANSSLLAYTTNEWTSVVTYPAVTRPTEGVEVAWFQDNAGTPPEPCPPNDNQAAYHITIRISHVIPVFFPGLQYLPALGTCDSSGCHISLSSTAQYRMEPKP